MYYQLQSELNRLQVLVVKRVKDGLTDQEIKAYQVARRPTASHYISDAQATFDMFDADGGGAMDSTELGQLLRVLGLNPSDQEVEALKREIDMDGDGEIEFEEFLLLMNSKLLRCSLSTLSVPRNVLSCRQLQVLDCRESRIRDSFAKLENNEGRISRRDIIDLVTVTFLWTQDV